MRFDLTLPLLLALAAFATLFSPPADGQPFRSVRTGLTVHLPPDWHGATHIDEAGLPARASYVFAASDTAALAGATLHVERATGLNPLQQQRWVRGQGPAFMQDAQAVAAARPSEAVFAQATALEVRRGGARGLAYFLVHGGAHYAVLVQVPAGRFEALRGALAQVARGVRLPS
ncbi:MAG: hypothetical protein ACK41D_00085 [Rubricoccaceae bacterium]